MRLTVYDIALLLGEFDEYEYLRRNNKKMKNLYYTCLRQFILSFQHCFT